MQPGTPRFPVTGMLAEARRLPEGTARGFLAFLRDEQTRFFILMAIVGLIAGGVALGVRSLTSLITHLAFGTASGNILHAMQESPWFLRLIIPAAGAAIAGLLLERIVRRGGAAGMSAILEAVTLRHGFLSLRRTLWVGSASVVALATGSSVGREGPITQVACAAASRLGRWLGLTEARVRIMVAAAAGAGIAAAYNTPIAGTLFVLEVVAVSFATDLIGPTVVAAVVGTIVSRIYLWEGPIYEVPHFEMRTPQEILFYAGIGLLAGLVAALFLGVLRLGEVSFRRVRGPRWLRAAFGGLCVGAIATQLPQVCGNGYETLVDILNARVGFMTLLLLLAAKMVATSSSVTSGTPGGLFTPTLFLGAALGGCAGNLVHHVFPDVTGGPSSYALVGMGALLAATTHAPMTATVLIAELTGDYVVVLPQLLACALAATVTHRMDSVYARELRRRGIHWEGTLEQKIVNSAHARDIMRTGVPVLRPDSPFEEVVRLFTTHRTPCLYVVTPDGKLTGAIELHAIKELLAARELSNLVIAQDLAEPARSVTADMPLATVNEKLWFIDTGEAPIVESTADPRFLGVITQRDLLGFLDREILRRNLLISEVRWRDGLEKGVDYLELPEGYRLESLDVPAQLVGKTMEQAELRARHGLNVIAVSMLDADGTARRRPPDPSYRLRGTDRLIAIASSEDVELFAKLRAGE